MSTQPRVDLLEDVGPVTLTKIWEVDGTQSDVGVVTIGIVDANGDEVVAAGTATTKTGSGSTTEYTYSLAAQAEPNRLKVTWTRATGVPLVDWIEVFGSQLFTEADARAYQISGAQTPLSSAAYTDAAIAAARLKIQDLFEKKTGRSWVRRYARVALKGSSASFLRPGDGRPKDSGGRSIAGDGYGKDIVRVISATVNGTALSTGNIVIDGGRLHLIDGTLWSLPAASNPLNVIVEYEYGIDPPDSEAHDNALELLVATLVPSDISVYADSFTNPVGTSSFVRDGWVYPNRVHEWLKRANMKIMV